MNESIKNSCSILDQSIERIRLMIEDTPSSSSIVDTSSSIDINMVQNQSQSENPPTSVLSNPKVNSKVNIAILVSSIILAVTITTLWKY